MSFRSVDSGSPYQRFLVRIETHVSCFVPSARLTHQISVKTRSLRTPAWNHWWALSRLFRTTLPGRCLHYHHQTHHARPMYRLFYIEAHPAISTPLAVLRPTSLSLERTLAPLLTYHGLLLFPPGFFPRMRRFIRFINVVVRLLLLTLAFLMSARIIGRTIVPQLSSLRSERRILKAKSSSTSPSQTTATGSFALTNSTVSPSFLST